LDGYAFPNRFADAYFYAYLDEYAYANAGWVVVTEG